MPKTSDAQDCWSGLVSGAKVISFKVSVSKEDWRTIIFTRYSKTNGFRDVTQPNEGKGGREMRSAFVPPRERSRESKIKMAHRLFRVLAYVYRGHGQKRAG